MATTSFRASVTLEKGPAPAENGHGASFIIRSEWLARADRVAEAVAARAAAHDCDDSFVDEGYSELKAEGLFKALVLAELGGGGASLTEIAACIRRIGAACGSTALAFAMHSH